MKDLKEYLLESKEDITRFKIDNLDDELESNQVSKSRRNEIKKFFNTILGGGPYYCISKNNSKGHDSIKFTTYKGDFGLMVICDEEDEYDKKYNERARKHNKEVEALSKEIQEKIKSLEENVIGLKLPKDFKFGIGKGKPTSLKGGICEFEGNYMPCIIQTEKMYMDDMDWPQNLITIYLACKDID